MPRRLSEGGRPAGLVSRLEVERPEAVGTAQAGRVDRLRDGLRSARTDLGPFGFALAMALAACISVLAILGTLHVFVLELLPFDLDEEQHLERLDAGPWESIVVPALFSAAVLLVASGLAFVTSIRSKPLPWAMLGLFFAFMGADEVLKFHENLEGAVHIDWQVLYLPLMLVGGACWLVALRCMWEFGTERLLWLGGAAAWIAASLIEFGIAFDYASSPLLPDETLLLEETLEMMGSAMFLLALYLVFGRTEARQPG
jgi:hypothetical protein